MRRSLWFVVFLLAALPLCAASIQVEVTQDVLAVDQVCTLREAVINANADAAVWPDCQAGSGLDVIEIQANGTLQLTIPNASLLGEDLAETGDLDIRSPIVIVGKASGTTINANNLDRHFHVNPDGYVGGQVVFTLSGVHLINGFGHGGAGSILANISTVNLDRVTISNCLGSQGDGGAIYMASASSLTMNNCTISGNTAAHHAGAIVVEGVATITNSTITNNASGFSNLTGGIRSFGGVTLRNTIVAGNAGTGLPNLDGTFLSAGYNIIGNLGNTPGNPTFVPTTGDQVGVNAALLNLGPLQNNGGGIATHALNAGSIAIDKGHSSGALTDQRFFPRPCNDGAIPNAPGGDGSDVGSYERQGACVANNSNPDAVNDTKTVAEDSGPNPVNVLANDTDPDGNSLTISAVTQPLHGSVVNNSSSVTYTPAANYFGSDSFTYTVSDGNGGFDTATVSVTVTNVNDAPDAVNDVASVAEDSSGNLISVKFNDTDADGNPLTITAVTQGAHGSVSHNGSVVTYNPAPNYFGSDSFNYTISDGQGGTDSATVSVTVTNVNDAPTAANDAYTMNQDTTLTVPAPGVLGNDGDIDGDLLSAQLNTNVATGLLALAPNGGFSYQPPAGFAGNVSFTYVAKDAAANSNIATVTIQVKDTQAPVVNAAVATALLWPPEHDLINVGLSFSAVDNVGVASTSVAVFSNEDDETRGGGDMSPDARDVATTTLRLRAERTPQSDGRVYLIRVTATDTSANTSRKCVTVVVPKSQSAADVAAVNSLASAAAAQCNATGLAPNGYFVVGDGAVVGPKQ